MSDLLAGGSPDRVRARVSKRVATAIARLLLLLTLLGGLQTNALAQSAEGTLGWYSGTSGPYATADEACHFQWNFYKGPMSRYVSTTPNQTDGNTAACLWTTYQYLCPAETGYGINGCGTILPVGVGFQCKPGYTPVRGLFCQENPPVPERPCNCNNGGAPNPTAGNPIVLSTGSKVLNAVDYKSADDDFTIRRSYRSIPFGRSVSAQGLPRGLAGGWAFDFAYEIQLGDFSGSPSSPSAKLAVAAPDGSAYDFVMQSGGAWVPDTTTGAYYANRNLKLEFVGTLPADLSTLQSASTQWRLTDENDTVWTFQTFTRPNTTSPYSLGRPTTRINREGYQWSLTYGSDGALQSIADSFGRTATFNWSMFYVTALPSPPAGSLPYREAISSIQLPDGTSLRYTYDPAPATAAPSTSVIERLIKVERLNSSGAPIDSTTYGYADPRFRTNVTSITDFNGDQVANYAYDGQGRATVTAHASGADNYAVANSETSAERLASVTNPLNKITQYHFGKFGNAQDVRISSIDGQPSTSTPASTRSFTYGTDNFVATETDEEGRVTTYTRDARGRPTTIVEATGTPQQRTTTITYDAVLNLPTRIVRTGLQTDYTYSLSGQLLTRTETDTTTHSVPYSTNGQTRTWTYTWGTGGRLTSINGPKPIDAQGNDDTLTFSYDAAGNLQTSTNGLGQVTAFGNYDSSGRPGTMTDPNNVVSAFTYDTLGRMTALTVKDPGNSSLDATTSFEYDIHDRVIGITQPGTDKLIIDYDKAGRTTSVRAASGERIDYVNDAEGNVSSQTVKRVDGSVVRSISRTFDELGRLLKETLGPSRTTTYGYDKVDNIKQVASARAYTTTAAFDPLNRLISTVAPDAGSSSTGYDALDNVTSYTDPVSVQTTFVRDGFGDVLQEVSPDRGTSTYYYNQAGEMTASVDGRGQRVDYTRDVLGRVTSKTPVGHSSEAVAYTWDTPGLTGSYGVGHLSSLTDATGTTSFAYDHRGNMIDKRQTISSAATDLAYVYDLADRIIQTRYPSGRLVAYDRDSKGRVTQVRTKESASAPSWTTLASSITYDPWGSLTAAQFGNGLSLAETWADGRLAAKRLYNTSSGANLSALAYIYDSDDNIGVIRDLVDDTNSMYYGYDGNQRMVFASLPVSSATGNSGTYSYATGTNRLSSIVDGSGTRSINYDARGNISGETRPGSVSVSTGYDGYGRLLTYARTGDLSQANAYNGLDDRVAATSGSVTHSFVYDPDGRLMGEYDATGVPVAETIWLSPGIANDNQPLGGDDGVGGYAPLAVVTGSGSGAALYWVHGNHMGVPIVTTDVSGALASPPVYTMAGFPGQTHTLSDVYYNRYRDYDSSTGRYLEADPIGLNGGNNPYSYANGNPLRWSDPWGLSPGERGATGGSSGQRTGNKYKHCRDHPTDPTKIVCRHHQTGKWIEKPKPADWPRGDKLTGCQACQKTAEVVTVGATAYVIYRCLRMLPSLLAPPLWWTIPENAVLP